MWGVIRAMAFVLIAGGIWGCAGGSETGATGAFGGVPWRTEGPEVRIGSLDGPEDAFSTVRSLALGPDGHLYSLHRNEGAARRWTIDGAPAGTVGREGQGPGEFVRPGALGFFGDTLWIMDTYAYRVSYFDLDGRYLDRVVPEVDIGGSGGGPVAPPRPERPLRDGGFIARSPAWSHEVAMGTLTATPVVHMSGEGGTVGAIWEQPWRAHDILALMEEDGTGSFMQQPFSDEELVAFVDDGLVTVNRRVWGGEGPAAFTVTRIGLSGDTVFVASVPYTPSPLPAARVDSFVVATAAELHEFLSRRDPGLALGALEQDIREATYGPAHLAPVDRVVVGGDGSIWLRRPEPFTDAEGAPMAEWWILSPEGAAVGRAYAPFGLTLHLVGEGAVWGVETDDLGVDYIVRYRLLRGG